MRSVRIDAYIAASGVNWVTPAAPWTWMARSMISSAMRGMATLMPEISVAAALLPTVSIRWAVRSTYSRAMSMLMRASAIQSWMRPLWATDVPNVVRTQGPVDHDPERPLGDADRAHAVVDAARAEAGLGDGEAAALLAEQVVGRHAHVLVVDLGVAAGVVVAEHVRRAPDADAGRVLRHGDHRLLQVPRRVRVGLAHHDEHLAASAAGRRTRTTSCR